MCFPMSNVITTTHRSWEGDEIVNRPIIRAARYVPGTRKRFDIDIREFLLSDSNAVGLERCREALDALPSAEERTFVRSTQRGAFDLRVRAVCSYLSQNVRYQLKKSADRAPEQ
jgi:hypothetical protein